MMKWLKLFGRKAEGYPGKGVFGRPDPPRRARVESVKCRGCGSCALVCVQGIISLDRKGKARISGVCLGCGACFEVCSSGAISMSSND